MKATRKGNEGGTGESREVYFEFITIGTVVRVAAIDDASGAEVSVLGPATAAASDLEHLALAKLRARLARDANL